MSHLDAETQTRRAPPDAGREEILEKKAKRILSQPCISQNHEFSVLVRDMLDEAFEEGRTTTNASAANPKSNPASTNLGEVDIDSELLERMCDGCVAKLARRMLSRRREREVASPMRARIDELQDALSRVDRILSMPDGNLVQAREIIKAAWDAASREVSDSKTPWPRTYVDAMVQLDRETGLRRGYEEDCRSLRTELATCQRLMREHPPIEFRNGSDFYCLVCKAVVGPDGQHEDCAWDAASRETE